MYFAGRGISDCSDLPAPGDDGWIMRRSYTNISFYLCISGDSWISAASQQEGIHTSVANV